MKLNIELTSCNSSIIVKDNSKYLPEDYTSIVKNKFKYSDTISIGIIKRNRFDENIFINPVFDNHSGNNLELPLSFDGWFTVYYIVLPNYEWVSNNQLQVGLYDNVYFSNGEHIYKYTNGTSSQIDIEDFINTDRSNSTISITYQDYISIYYLRKNFIETSAALIKNRLFSNCINTNRDFLWSMINLIEYYTENRQLAEIERLIEIYEQNGTETQRKCNCTTLGTFM